MKVFGKLSSRATLSAFAVIVLVFGTSVSASAVDDTTTFDITVDTPFDPCAGATDYAASWSPDADVTLTNSATLASGLGNVNVLPGEDVNMTLNLNFADGSLCFAPVNYSGAVTAVWTISGLDVSTQNCDGVISICDASSMGGVLTATASVPALTSPSIYSGSVTVTWVPGD